MGEREKEGRWRDRKREREGGMMEGREGGKEKERNDETKERVPGILPNSYTSNISKRQTYLAHD